MKELQVNILDDYEHLITGAIDRHGNESSFPKMEENITRKELEDYLYEYQCILDSEGTQRLARLRQQNAVLAAYADKVAAYVHQ